MSPFWIELDAGPHPRSNFPVCVELGQQDIPLDDSLPWLDRDGRKRTIPCQWETFAGKRRLWWIVPEMQAGEKDRYTLTFDRRERSSPIRWRAEETTKGWSLAEQDLRVLDLLVGRNRPFNLSLFGPTGTMAQIRPVPIAPPAEQTPYRRFLARPVDVARGPIFARWGAIYDVRGEHDRLIAQEEILLRIFPSQRGARVIDLDITWHASACPILLSYPQTDRPTFWPTLRLELGSSDFQLTASSGRIGTQEIDDSCIEWIDIEQGPVRLVLIARSGSFGFPPRIRWSPPAFYLSPQRPAGPTADHAIRLALGESYRMSLRWIIMPTAGRSVDDVMSMSLDPICRVTSQP
jgi:hypothetical protein